MAMANGHDQSAVAYGSSPDSEEGGKPMPGSGKQFGNGSRMPQDKKYSAAAQDGKPMKGHLRKMQGRHGRHKEHR